MPKEIRPVVDRLAGAMVLLLITVSVTALGLHAWRLRSVARSSEARTLAAVVRLGTVQIAEAAPAATSDPGATAYLTSQFERWSWAAMRQPGVLATGLVDARGELLTAVPADMPVGRILSALGSARQPGDLQVVALPDSATKYHVISRPFSGDGLDGPPGELVLIAAARTLPTDMAPWCLAFALPMAGVAAIASAGGLWWLRRSIHRPLQGLARRQSETDAAWLDRLPQDSPDEIGGIARQTAETLSELREARTELARTQRSVDSHVANETRQIKGLLANVQKRSWQDPLTRLGNRHLLEERLEDLVAAEITSGRDLALVMFDIDHFKQHNDTQGHAAGDDLLRFLGDLLQGGMREQDIGIRYGGDEFVVLLPNVAPHEAAALADRIVRLFAQHASTLGTKPAPTLSAGVASMRHCAVINGRELMAQADAALYEAKRSGKNCVSVRATPDPIPPAPPAICARQ